MFCIDKLYPLPGALAVYDFLSFRLIFCCRSSRTSILFIEPNKRNEFEPVFAARFTTQEFFFHFYKYTSTIGVQLFCIPIWFGHKIVFRGLCHTNIQFSSIPFVGHYFALKSKRLKMDLNRYHDSKSNQIKFNIIYLVANHFFIILIPLKFRYWM